MRSAAGRAASPSVHSRQYADPKTQKQQKAAALIQTFFRGYLARKAYKKLKAATQTIQKHAKGWYTRKKVAEARQRKAMDSQFQDVMARHRERMYVLERHKRLVVEQPSRDIEMWQDKRMRAAARIQAAWRGYAARKRMVRLDPERARREAESQDIQKAFRSIITKAQASHAHDMAEAASAAGGGGDPDSPVRGLLPPAVRQSATVLMGSPEKGGYGLQAEVDAGPGGLAARNQYNMSSKRYAQLKKQVEERVQAYKNIAKHRRPDVYAVDTRLKALLQEYNTSAADRLAAAHARAGHVVALEALSGALDTGGLRPLSSLVDPEPVDFPRPARGSERWERAMQAHATSLADARAGHAWWRHLRTLNRGTLQQALIQEDQERWQDLDGMWRRQWSRLEALENLRPDPLAELRLRSANAPKSSLADIAVHEPDVDPQLTAARDQQKGGAVAGAVGTGGAAQGAGLAAELKAAGGGGVAGQGLETVVAGPQPDLQGGGISGGAHGAREGLGRGVRQAPGDGATGVVSGTQTALGVPVAQQPPLPAHLSRVDMLVVQGPLGAFVAPAADPAMH